MITLPTVPIAPTSCNPARVVLYSPPKMGKTTFASQLENNLILDLEDGSNFVTALKVKITSLAELDDTCRAILAAGKPYKYGTVDTISRLELWCEGEATQDYMNSGIGKSFNRVKSTGAILPRHEWESVLTLPNGAGYFWLRKSFKMRIARLQTCFEHLILIGHMKDKTIEKQGELFALTYLIAGIS